MTNRSTRVYSKREAILLSTNRMCDALKSGRISLLLCPKLVLGFEATTVYTFRHVIYSNWISSFDLIWRMEIWSQSWRLGIHKSQCVQLIIIKKRNLFWDKILLHWKSSEKLVLHESIHFLRALIIDFELVGT
jgi:hypothetical protein